MQTSKISFKAIKKEDYNKYGSTKFLTDVCNQRAKLERDATREGKADVAVFVDPEDTINRVKSTVYYVSDGKEGRIVKHLIQDIEQNKDDTEAVKILRIALYRIQKHFMTIAK